MTDDRSTYVYRWLIDHSQIYAHWISWLRLREAASGSRTPQPQRFLESRTSSEEYLNNMSAMVQLARQRKVPFIVLAAPFRDHTENGPDAQRMLLNRLALGDLMKNDEAQYLEIREMTEDTYPANDKFFGERIHPSQIGHKLIASEVMKFIAAQHLLPVLNVPPFEP